jgi:tRNA G26 N,N-dimethylase Trm1
MCQKKKGKYGMVCLTVTDHIVLCVSAHPPTCSQLTVAPTALCAIGPESGVPQIS